LRDPVVAQAIKNVADRYQVQDFWVLLPREITKAIYDEIRRLDRARINETVASLEAETVDILASDGVTN
jgi:hypothetical protein